MTPSGVLNACATSDTSSSCALSDSVPAALSRPPAACEPLGGSMKLSHEGGERPNDVWVELGRSARVDLRERVLHREGPAVRPLVRHRVERVDDREDSRG